MNIDEFETIIDIGSSSLYFRKVIQPFIEIELFEPLKEAGKKVYHMDKKQEIGVDLVFDVNNLDELQQQFDVVLCCNLLEHIRDPMRMAMQIKNLVKKNGFLIVTLPFSYPYHCDPFDNLWRPDPYELVRVFHEYKPLALDILKVKTTPYKFLSRRLLSLFETLYIGQPWVILHNLQLTFRHPYSTSCAFFQNNT